MDLAELAKSLNEHVAALRVSAIVGVGGDSTLHIYVQSASRSQFKAIPTKWHGLDVIAKRTGKFKPADQESPDAN